jgi:hypothetical protein
LLGERKSWLTQKATTKKETKYDVEIKQLNIITKNAMTKPLVILPLSQNKWPVW